MFHDTIIAQSSAPASGGLRALVRISGEHAWEIAATVAYFESRGGYHPRIAFRLPPDMTFPGTLLLFKGPKSFTGEDIAELHIPNSPPIIRALIDTLLALAKEKGIALRTADPGEFSARAFFNGKVDLTEAEGIAATINATQRTQLRAAAGLRQGTLHRDIAGLTERVAGLLALVEAGIDFADEEDIRFIEETTLTRELTGLREDVHARLADSLHLETLTRPPTVVLVGNPNVGKSSLINSLTGIDRSIVSPVAGTTRDILSASLQTPQGEIRLIDLPGEELPTDELRQKMMQARDAALLDADVIVEVLDASGQHELPNQTSEPAPALRILNKIDLHPVGLSGPGVLPVSTRTGEGIAALREKLIALATARHHVGGERLALNHRHRALLLETQRALTRAAALVGGADRHPELLASELRAGLDHLGQITGTVSPDDVLGRIFSQFCLGK